MKRLYFFLCFVMFSGCFCYARADQTPAAYPEVTTGIYTEGRISLQLVSGALFSLTGCPEGSQENWSGCSVSVILTSNNSVLHNIPMGNGPYHIVITPNGDFAYVTVPGEDLITVIGFPEYF